MSWVFLVAYSLSGAAGLIYEVSWTRTLALVMGHGLAASSTVLASFMGGLALGAMAGGRVAARVSARQALLAYAGLELTVALLARLLPWSLSALTPLFATTYDDGAGGWAFAVTRVLACALLLLPPAMALGATLPLAVRWLTDGTANAQGQGRLSGRLYAANTAGAAAGAALSGFVLIPSLGASGATWVGVAASLAAAALVLLVAQRVGARAARGPLHADGDAHERPVAPAPPPSPPTSPRRGKGRGASGAGRVGAASMALASSQPASPPPQPGLALALVIVTGIATFSAEVAWTRVFSLVIGPSTYAFAATVTAFITGLAIGALAGTAIGGRTTRPALACGIVLGLGALAAAWAVSAAGTSVPRRVLDDFAAAPAGALLASHAWLMALLIVPAAVGIGAVFPLTFYLAGGQSAPARMVALIYAANTLASVAGSLVTGFVAVPMLGIERTLQLLVVLVILASAGAIVRSAAGLRGQALAFAPAAGAAVLLLTAGAWDRELLASGSYKYAADVAPGLDVETALRAGSLVYYKDGPTGTVSVKQLTGQLSLAIDGKIDASTAGDMLTQKLLAHLPLLMHEQPQSVAVVGLGSGVTLAAALTHPVQTVDVLEISPEVAEASRLFAAGGPSPLDDPRTRLIVADGRTHLALTSRQYDVVVSEPSNPWMSGVAALFTREFFRSAQARLTPHGLVCQWVNIYDISLEDLRSVVATFASVFPHTTMWMIGEGDLLLLGAAEPFDGRFARLPATWMRPGVSADLQRIAVDEPFALLSLFSGGDEVVARFAGRAPLQVDDRMALEFSAPRALRTGSRQANVEALRAASGAGPQPAVITAAWAAASGEARGHRARMLRRAGAYAPAYEAALDALAHDPAQADGLAVLVDTAVATGRQRDALARLTDLAAHHPDAPAPLIALSRLHAGSGALDAAARAATSAVTIAPGDPQALEQLASVFADAGDGERLEPVVAALSRHADRPGSHYYAAAQRFLAGDLSGARVRAERALELDRTYARAHNLLGAIAATQAQTDAARAAFAEALRLDPRDPSTYQNLGLLELNAGRTGEAGRLFAEALSLDPSSAPAREGLARARATP